MELIKQTIGQSFRKIAESYSANEASSWITMTYPDDPVDLRVSTIGTALPCNEIKIVDIDSGTECGVGKKGELCTRGFLMKGYYKMPGATSAAIDEDGWFHTGDLGIMDDKGYVSLVGRIKEVINKAGKEVYPAELEEVLYALPEVAQAQVFGFTDKDGVTRIGACVKLKKGCNTTVEDIRSHMAIQLEADKLPEFIKIVDEFPVTKSGKIQRFKLAEMASAEWEQHGC